IPREIESRERVDLQLRTDVERHLTGQDVDLHVRDDPYFSRRLDGDVLQAALEVLGDRSQGRPRIRARPDTEPVRAATGVRSHLGEIAAASIEPGIVAARDFRA